MPVPGPWLLQIDGASLSLDKLESWTRYDQFRYFSGTATYRGSFDVSDTYVADGLGLSLSLGEVREIADIELNGRPAGVVWMAPFRQDVTGRIRRGKNQVVIKVTNLLINRVLGQPKPDVSALMEAFANKFAQFGSQRDLKFEQNPEKDVIKEPLPSGLLGPIEIRPFWRSG